MQSLRRTRSGGGKVKVKVHGRHKVVRQAQDEAANQGRQSPFIDVAAEDAKREVCVAANSDHDEPDAPEDGAHGNEVGDVDRIGVGGALAQSAKGSGGHGAVARRVRGQRPWSDEGTETLNDPVARDGDSPMLRGVMAQAGEVLRAFGQRQGFPEA